MRFKPYCTYCLFISGILSFVSSLIFLFVWPHLYFKVLSEHLVLTRNSSVYDMWYDIPIPMYLEIYLFNFTNTEEVSANHSVKPKFEELGPYVFRERHIKVNQTWFDDNSTVTYFLNRTWVFHPEMSNGTLSDEVTNINLILSTVAHTLKSYSSDMLSMLSVFFTGLDQNIFITKTAGELLFDGYDDAILDLFKNLSNSSIPIPINKSDIYIPFDKFGWFYARNGSEKFEGEYNMFTGVSDVNKLGLLHTWNRKNKTRGFRDGCNAVKGTPGDLWTPNTNVEYVTLFVSDICGSLSFKNVGKTVVDGINGAMFVGDDSVFDNGWKYPEKACYCPKNRTLCKPPGVLDMSSCQYNSPSYLSFPHFYLADESYVNSIEGVTPNKERDEFRIILAENVGIPLLVRVQLQISTLVENVPGFDIINKHIPEMMVPNLWFKQEIHLPDDYIQMTKLITNLSYDVDVVLYFSLCISVVAVGVAVMMYKTRRLRHDPETEILVQDTN